MDGTRSAPMNLYFEASLPLSQFRWVSLWLRSTARASGSESQPAVVQPQPVNDGRA